MTDATPIKCIILDVDGTLTDGSIIYDSQGGELKHFHVADGLGIRLAQAVGIRVAVISSRQSEPVRRRMTELNVTDIIQASGDKRLPIFKLQAKYGLEPGDVAFVGDDLNDLPAFEAVGTRIAVSDADILVKNKADHVTSRRGGRGAVREAIEYILRRDGRYEEAVVAYMTAITGLEASAPQ